jgi:hypothetical protein
MVERRVVVRNAAGVHGHVRVAVALDGSSVSLHRPQEVRLRSERETRGVVHVANTVEAWLKLWMGDHSYAVIAGSSQRHPVIGAIAAPQCARWDAQPFTTCRPWSPSAAPRTLATAT